MAFQSKQFLFSFVFSLLVICLAEFPVANSLRTEQHLCHDGERSSLLKFNQSFTIDCSLASGLRGAHPTTSSWDVATNCCLWEGVKCNNETGHVTGLNLSNSCLYGTFPRNTTLFSIHHLEELILAFNNFNNSPIPSGLGHKLHRLTSLDLSSSEFSGEVPSDISKLSRLSLLDLSFNSGLQLKAISLERLVQNLTHLNTLILDSVDISSPLPNLLANLTSLRAVVLRFCNLYGEFPTSIFHMPHLQELDLSGNTDLAGFLPSFDHSSSLRSLVISHTSFSGEIPSSVGRLGHLEDFQLSNSKFSGQVPFSVGNLTKVTDLELYDNYFYGDVPTSFANLTQLQSLSLSDLNAKPEKLVSWLSKLKLLSLDLKTMNLVGEIPSVIANFTGLTHLNLIGNHLTGHIPHWVTNLTQLKVLALSDNKLEGTVPPMISQLKHLLALYLNGNRNLQIDIDTLLKNRNLIYLDLAGVPLTFPSDIATNESVAKLTLLRLDSCNLTEFPPILDGQDELRVLLLSDNRLQGVIPQWFVNKTKDNLLELDLSYNFLTGFEQPAVILPWSNLEILYLLQNQIQGSLPIPPNSLMMYQISNNSLTGDFPQEFCSNAIALNYLDLSFNHLSGRVPECISQLAGLLEIINLEGNNFDGIIPSVYPKSCKLKMINLSQNRLAGVVPRSLENCKMLEVLDMGKNQINDTFPSWLGSLPNLHILVLRHNNFHGKIGRPNATFGFQSLHILDLSHNFHIGSLPSDYFQMWDAMKVVSEDQLAATGTTVTITLKTPHNLFLFPVVNYSYTITITNKGNDLTYTKILNVFRVVDFSNNKFTGRIPDSVGQLKGLQAINLSNNNLEGGIPSSLANTRDLESLDLSNNKLSGMIPQQLTQLTYLEVFNVSHNLLVGPLPQGNQFDTFDNSSFSGNLGLCGGTLSRKCENADEPPSLGSVSDNEEDDNAIDWVVRSMGCVSGLIIGYIIGKYVTDKNHEWFVETFRRRKTRTKTKPR